MNPPVWYRGKTLITEHGCPPALALQAHLLHEGVPNDQYPPIDQLEELVAKYKGGSK